MDCQVIVAGGGDVESACLGGVFRFCDIFFGGDDLCHRGAAGGCRQADGEILFVAFCLEIKQ